MTVGPLKKKERQRRYSTDSTKPQRPSFALPCEQESRTGQEPQQERSAQQIKRRIASAALRRGQHAPAYDQSGRDDN